MSVIRRQNKELMRMSCSRAFRQLHNRSSTGARSDSATPADVFAAWREYRTDDISSLVTQDVLLMAGSKDHYMPLSMLPDQLMALTAAHSVSARVFTEAESAQNHCQIGNMGLALKVILDWLDETGGRVANRRASTNGSRSS